MASRHRISILIGIILLVCVAFVLGPIFRPHPESVEDKAAVTPVEDNAPTAVAEDQTPATGVQLAIYKSPLMISVQARYPGANAQTVADTVAAPIR